MIRVFRHPSTLSAENRGAVVALGNFDGVHRGHQAVIAAAKAVADQAKVPLAVMTFEPHPRTFFDSLAPPFRLTPLRTKIQALAGMGVEIVYVLRFNRKLAHFSAEEFVQRILVQGCRVRHVVAGEDFVFGRNREGHTEMLKNLGQSKGFETTVVPPFIDQKGEIFSSTLIRQSLKQGNMQAARHLLGRPWMIEGRVVRGEQKGRTIGIPTANIHLKNYLRPALGVYAVRVRWSGQTLPLQGIANIGLRPTVGGAQERLEVHLLDQKEGLNLYGHRLCVELLQYLRPEQKFPSLAALQVQIADDIVQARKVFES